MAMPFPLPDQYSLDDEIVFTTFTLTTRGSGVFGNVGLEQDEDIGELRPGDSPFMKDDLLTSSWHEEQRECD